MWATLAAAKALAVFDAAAERLAAAFWPGPLTLVLPKSAGCPVAELATAGLDTIAVRLPAHAIARALIARLGKPVVAPSANRSGHVSPTTADHVMADLADRIDLVLDGGPAPVGLESTILACLDGSVTLLRPGGLPRDAIERVLGRPVREAAIAAGTDEEVLLAPGMLASHYAPRATSAARRPRGRTGRGAAGVRTSYGVGRRAGGEDAEPLRARRSGRGGREPVFPFARARPRRRARHRGGADSA